MGYSYSHEVLEILAKTLKNDNIQYVRDSNHEIMLIKKQLPDGRCCWTYPTEEEKRE